MKNIQGCLKTKTAALGLALLVAAAVTGCVGYVDGGPDVDVIAPGPDVYLFGGYYGHYHDVHAYSVRGHASWHAAHVAPHGGGGFHGHR